jgi:hypothetical protein
VRFVEEDDPVAYADLMGFPEALPIWTSPASMAGLEATVERIQNCNIPIFLCQILE